MSKDITVKLKRLAIIFKCLTDEKGKEFTAEELAKKCNTSYRTILRDISLIKKAVIELDSDNGKYSIDKDWSLEKIGLIPQTAASLCIAYEDAEQAGDDFIPVCKYIRRLFSPDRVFYEINPKLPKSPLISKLQKAIKEKHYIKIVSDGRQISAKPYCLIRKSKMVYLVFATVYKRSSVWGYGLERINVEMIESVSFRGKSRRIKNGHFASLGVSKWQINEFIRFNFSRF